MRMNKGFNSKLKVEKVKSPKGSQVNLQDNNTFTLEPKGSCKKNKKRPHRNGVVHVNGNRVNGRVITGHTLQEKAGRSYSERKVYVYPMGVPKSRFKECELCGTKNPRRRISCKTCGGRL